MDSKIHRDYNYTVLVHLNREGSPSSSPTKNDEATDLNNDLPQFPHPYIISANLNTPVRENTDFYMFQKKQSDSDSSSSSGSKRMLDENIETEEEGKNTPMTPKDKIIRSDVKIKTPGAPHKKPGQFGLRKIGLQHIRQPDFSFCPYVVS
ncbi:hypothetical protein SUGI_0721290 [Cryptomeria japonica]|nr:hypothetical protein SUGI_0721290 [Cryptomeria japonica]